jgi:hypothetical protein
MNCDRVFEILTAGPFPSGQSHDAAVELHLLACHECRQLAEALRPAVALFHEAIDPDEGGDLPGYHGSLEMASRVEPPMIGTLPIPRRRMQQKINRRRLMSGSKPMFVQFAAAVAVGMLLCWAVSSLELGVSKPAPAVALVSAVETHVPSAEEHLSLVALNLPIGCYRSHENPADGAAAMANHCCIECHSNKEPVGVTVQPLVLAKSCGACHAP